MTLYEPLDLEHWLVTTLAGDYALFGILSILIVSIVSYKFRLPTPIFIMILAIWLSIIRQFVGLEMWILLAILIGAPVAFYWIKRLTD